MRANSTVLVATAAAATGLLASIAWAAPCNVAVRLGAPKAVVAGKKFSASATIKNTGATHLDGLFFQLELPDFMQPRAARASAFATKGASNPDAVLDRRFIRFGGLRLPARKTLRIKVSAGVPTCQAAGAAPLQALAYQLDAADSVACSTAATITTTVVRKVGALNAKHAVQGNCTEPGPGTAGMALVGANERCMQSQPLPGDQARRFRSLLEAGAGDEATGGRAAHRMLAASQSAAQACYACCAEFLGVAPPYYFNVAEDGRCYCCEDCDPVYVPGWTNYLGLEEPEWHRIDSSSNGNAYWGVTSSADGSKLLANDYYFLWKSVNFGANWTKVANLNPGGQWASVKCSSGFEVCLALQSVDSSNLNGEIFRSVDGGNTWAAVPGTKQGRWFTAACDATGTKWVAALGYSRVGNNQPGALYVSTDSGASFTMVQGSNNNLRWRSAACDASFNDCVVGPVNDGPGNILIKPYRLTNLQTLTELQGAQAGDYAGLAMSADGERIVAALEFRGTNYDFAGSVWYSLDGGHSWTQSDAPLAYYGGLACDDAVKHCAAAPSGDPSWNDAMMVTSCDGGSSWTSSPPLASWTTAVTVDGDGGRMVVGRFKNGAHALYSFPLAV